MAQDINFDSQTSTAAVVAAPPFFSASMRRDAPIGALISIIVGFSLLIVKELAFPTLDLNAWMLSAISSIDPEIGLFAGAILSIPGTSDPNTSMSLLKFIYAVFISFPSVIGWFIGGFIVGFLRIRTGRDEGNLKGGWSVFWYGVMAIEIPFAVLGVMFLLFTLDPSMIAAQGYTGGLLLFFLLFFVQPTFWLGLLLSLVGSLVGSTIARKQI